jgi:hypothetical protein
MPAILAGSHKGENLANNIVLSCIKKPHHPMISSLEVFRLNQPPVRRGRFPFASSTISDARFNAESVFCNGEQE